MGLLKCILHFGDDSLGAVGQRVILQLSLQELLLRHQHGIVGIV